MADSIETAAQALRSAYGGSAIEPLRAWLDPADGDGGYAVQNANCTLWMAQGRRRAGRKIGLTAPAVQAMMGVDEPDYGTLFEDVRLADGGSLDPVRAIAPRAEGEVALVLGRDLSDPAASAEAVVAAVDRAHAAIEICDSRIAEWRISFADTVADNGSAGFFVLADEGRPLAGLDLYACGMVMEVDGKVASLGAGAAAHGHPLNALHWLARKLAERGDPLRAGDIVLTGSLGAIVPLAPGNRVRVTIGGLGSCGFDYART